MVWAIAASADGSRVFVGGDFTKVDGQTRNRIAAFDTATGALVPNWKPSVSYRVKAEPAGEQRAGRHHRRSGDLPGRT